MYASRIRICFNISYISHAVFLTENYLLLIKEYPKQLLLNNLPHNFDILCTHPMFGPDSGKYTWKDLKFVFEKVRIH